MRLSGWHCVCGDTADGNVLEKMKLMCYKNNIKVLKWKSTNNLKENLKTIRRLESGDRNSVMPHLEMNSGNKNISLNIIITLNINGIHVHVV